MRNGKTLLQWMGVMVVVAVAATGCVISCSATDSLAAAQELEATDSGAPSAMVMFPVSQKPNPKGSGMKPVVFNHLIHEKQVTDCETCHHTGDTVACASCHTVEGKVENGKAVPSLDRAMHAENLATGKGKPSSCVSCHQTKLQQRQCAGCHSLVVKPERDASYCGVCHNAVVTPAQMAQGVAGTLPADQNEAVAKAAVFAKKPTLIPADKTPYRIAIDAVADKYEACSFTHARHVSSLMKRMGDDKLAAAFHNDPATLCSACHHNSPLSATPPRCGNCHAKTIDPATPERPALKSAYHLQCMGCHDAMKVARPQNTSCTTCHKERAK